MKTIRRSFLLALAVGVMLSPWLDATAGEKKNGSMAVGDVIQTTLDVKLVYDEADKTTWVPMPAAARVSGFPGCWALLTFQYDPVNRNFTGEAQSISCPTVGGTVDMPLNALATRVGFPVIRPDGEEMAGDLPGSSPTVTRNGGLHTVRATLNAGDEIDLLVAKASPVPAGLPKLWKAPESLLTLWKSEITPSTDQSALLLALSPVAYETFRQMEKRHHLVYSANQLGSVSQTAEFKAEFGKQMARFCATTSGVKNLACHSSKG